MNSLFNGWHKQCFFTNTDYNGAYCAMGWLWNKAYGRASWQEVAETEERVGRYIQQHYDLPEVHMHEANPNFEMHPRENASQAVIYANNNLKLTPEDFRRIDLLTREEAAGMPAIEALVESVEVGVGR